jgi:hypothetical protein
LPRNEIASGGLASEFPAIRPSGLDSSVEFNHSREAHVSSAPDLWKKKEAE